MDPFEKQKSSNKMRMTENSRFFMVISLLLAAANFATANPPTPVGDISKKYTAGWQYVEELSDEFTGITIDREKWNVDTEDWGVWSWDPQNAYIKDGSLQLQMVQETHQRGKDTFYYKSGIARSYKTINYGYFEARVKGCSRYPGACPSFWLHSKDPKARYRAKDGETAVYSEIDIVELQQCEWDFAAKKWHDVNHIDCNLHTILLKQGKKQWVRPNGFPEICKNEYDAPWDPREDYHLYAVENSPESITWYIDGKEVAKKPNLYWHLPMHVTLSLGLRHPFETYKGGVRSPVPEETTTAGFPTTMSVDYVRVWKRDQPQSSQRGLTKTTETDMTKEEFVASEEAKWAKAGWRWDQAKVESNFAEMDTNQDGLASGKERQAWFAKKKASLKK